MISNKQSTLSKNSEIISASEIGQYNFCIVSWYLQRCGYKPRSESLEKGKKQHENIGIILKKTERKLTSSRILRYIGYVLFLISFILILYEVIL